MKSSASHLFLAMRDNNPKRKHCIINTRQAKHFPSDPNASLEHMEQLGQKLAQDGRSGKITAVVAFAETATAIGAVVSGFFHDCFFVTTTREKLPDWAEAITFEECHSHAKQHFLCVRDEDAIRRASQVIFVDDEFTTGKTAVNLKNALDGCLAPGCDIYAAALSASAESIERFKDNDMTPVFLNRLEDIENRLEPENIKPDRIALPREYDEIIRKNSIFDQRLGVDSERFHAEVHRFCMQLAELFPADKAAAVEIIGTEEFCYVPLILGKMLSGKFCSTVVHCTTRSPILPAAEASGGFGSDSVKYPITDRVKLPSVYDAERTSYLYNSQPCDLSIIMTDAEEPGQDALKLLCGAAGGKKVFVICWHGKKLPTSYPSDDVQLLLTDITGKLEPLPARKREPLLQSGIHYSELLPAEYKPSDAYIREYERGLELWAKKNADAVRTVAEAVWAEKGRRAVLVSLARAGTPAGVLIKRYIRKKYGVSLPHYSISIIIGRGIDHRAMEYILARHSADRIQFVDGWTGKGTINRTLRIALEQFPFYEYGIGRNTLERMCSLAVLADPAGVCRLCGTHEDMFIPCACLNSVVSGLFSRTVLKAGVIQPDEFHGAAYFGEFSDIDRSMEFIYAIEKEMTFEAVSIPERFSGSGLNETIRIAGDFGVTDKLVKPGIGEATRVLLRRLPEMVLLKDKENPLTRHIVELAAEKGVEVREYPLENYMACGIVRVMDNV